MIRLHDFTREFERGATDVRGLEVFDRDGQEVGRVDALFIDEVQRKVRFLGVEISGPWRSSALIPVDAITRMIEERLVIEQPRVRVLASPPYLTDAAALSEVYISAVYEHYGYSPHWAQGNIFPGYPSR